MVSGRVLLRGGLVLSMDPTVGDFASGDVLIEGDEIFAIGPGLEADAEVVDCSGRIVMPGFVNSHHHMFQTALRSYWSDALAADYFTQSREGDTAIFHTYTPEDVYWGQYGGALEQLNAGTTTVVDTSQCSHTPAHTDAAVDGITASGARVVFAYSAQARGGKPDPSYAFPEDIRRLRDGPFATDDGLVTLAMGTPVSEHNWRLAREHDLPIYSHINDEAMGLDLERIGELGLAGEWNTYIHCTGLAPSTWRTIAATGGKVSLSSLVEQTLCTGMPGMQGALDFGIEPSFSTDAVSLGPTDFFTQMRAAYALQRSRVQERMLAGDRDVPAMLDTRDILRLATIAGARAAHLEHRVGSLTPGKQADVLVLDARALNAAPLNHATGAIVMMMDTSNVESVMVAGRFVKRGGRLCDVEVDKVVGALQRSAEGLLARSNCREVLLRSCRTE